MDIVIPDLPHLTLRAILTLTVLIGLVDTGYAVLQASLQHVLDASFLPRFLISHAAKVWFPIAGLALLGNGLATLDVPPIPVVTLAAEAGLVAYLVATVKSLSVNTGNSAAPPA